MKGELHISAREATACTYLPDDICYSLSFDPFVKGAIQIRLQGLGISIIRSTNGNMMGDSEP
jgi:hypothetical protein